jgi:hypothetical protein
MKYSIFFLVLIASWSCKDNSPVNLLAETENIVHKDLALNYKAVVFLPSSGCGGCISRAEEFLVNQYIEQQMTGIYFIVTGHFSKKTARLRLGDALQHQDVYFDYEQKFSSPPFLTQFPKVIFIKDGQQGEVAEINPATGENLYSQLLDL